MVLHILAYFPKITDFRIIAFLWLKAINSHWFPVRQLVSHKIVYLKTTASFMMTVDTWAAREKRGRREFFFKACTDTDGPSSEGL